MAYKLSKMSEVDLSSSYLSIDLETNGLFALECDIILIQICSDTGTWMIDAREPMNTDFLKPIMADRSVTKIFHNGAFDATFLKYHYDWDINRIHDTMLAERVLLGHTQRGSASLHGTVLNRMGVDLEKGLGLSFMDMNGAPFSQEQLKYGYEDIQYLKQVMDIQVAESRDRDLANVMNLENRLLEVIVDMKVTGIYFDTEKWLKIAEHNENHYNKLVDELNEITNHEVKNWGSPMQVKKYINANCGVNVTSITEIFELKSDDIVIKKLVQLRQTVKSVTSYGKGWLKTKMGNKPVTYKNTVVKNRVHCDYTQIIESGRFACQRPNLQQIPNEVASSYALRFMLDDVVQHGHKSCFISTPGYTMAVSDFTSQELAIIAAGAQEESWINAILDGKDLHSIMGSMIFRDRWEDGAEEDCAFKLHTQKCKCPRHKVLRDYAKNLNFGLAYGLGANSFADRMDLSRGEAYSIINKYNQSVPKIYNWLNENGRQAVLDEESYTSEPFRRFRSLKHEPQEWRKRNMGKNQPVQGTGADIMKLSMVRLDEQIQKRGLDARILHCVHDEMISEAHDSIIDEFALLQQECMETAATEVLGIPLIKAPTSVQKFWEK